MYFRYHYSARRDGFSWPGSSLDRLARVLAEDARADLDLPGVDNSALDGYALRRSELAATPSGLAVTLRADAVVPQEQVNLDAVGRVHVEGELAAGANIRRRGEESRAGDVLLAAGARLNAAAIALLASQGIDVVTVRRRVRVALVSTGNELIAPGQVYNSNAAMLRALLAQQGCEVLDLGVVADTAADLGQCFARAREQADLVVCTGGVSVGEEDHVRPVLERLGGISFHGMAIKPGKPFALGWIGPSLRGGTPLIGLPGNPVASLVGWQWLALPLVQGRQGRTPPALQRFPVTAGFSRRASRGRRELLRVVLGPPSHAWPAGRGPTCSGPPARSMAT